MHGNNVSFTATFFQTAAIGNFQVIPLVRGVVGLSALAGVAIFFKPLLTGIARALVLAVRPRLTREEQASRRHMRDAQLFKRMINSSQGASHAAELRAMAARG
jgi:hypothetical protein